MKTKLLVLVALAIALAGALALRRNNAPRSEPAAKSEVRAENHPASATPAATMPPASKPVMEVPPAPEPPAAMVHTDAAPAVATTKAAKTNGPAAKAGKQPLQDPLARDALGMVGADPEAEEYWMEAIFDRSLPDQEREDLMEDLNEVGLSDPKNPSPEDLQLIAARIPIIEAVAQDAAGRGDTFMIEHLGEAYKDLIGMLNGQPPP
jgi:hypothetical protein